MALDPRIAAFLDAHTTGPAIQDLPLAEFRAVIESMVAYCAPTAPVAQVRDLAVPGPGGPVPVRLYHPRPGSALPVVVYLHGGGWMTGSIDHMDPVCRALASEAESVVLNVGYRLAPEHPFPAALDDAWAVTAWAAANAASFGGDPARLAVAGDSAGANLATVVAMLARDAGGPPIAHQLLICPALDTAMDSGSYRTLGDGYGCTRAVMRLCWQTYLAMPEEAFPDAPWQAVPMRAPDLAGLPPATVLTMEYDPLRDEGEAYAERLAAAGVPVRATRCLGVIHPALHLDAVSPRAAQARQLAVAALREAFALGPPDVPDPAPQPVARLAAARHGSPPQGR
ncbi:alpha/beta hydrolase [Peterkaempfera bronchialis]|uniref:Alpha/beta hydrolase n=1 Tax=Peterkaempfera bronchialis TaxID=2126346 RepID=A0A345T4J3_9ACTN|nr:alpha/beta hydrolase [Peterkaempfera bronchialis]AXI80898.1 alpha/beta hydrolase [Peterkaempfera bronchialis]